MIEIAEVWFDRAKELEVEEALFIRVAHKKEQTALINEFERLKKLFAAVDSVLASQIFVKRKNEGLKMYVVLERKYRAPFTAIHRDADGNLTKVDIDPERSRIIRLMQKDYKTRKEIEDVIGVLTEEELRDFFGGK